MRYFICVLFSVQVCANSWWDKTVDFLWGKEIIRQEVNSGYEELKNKDTDKARESFNNALKREPENPNALLGLASTYQKTDPRKSLEITRNVETTEPELLSNKYFVQGIALSHLMKESEDPQVQLSYLRLAKERFQSALLQIDEDHENFQIIKGNIQILVDYIQKIENNVLSIKKNKSQRDLSLYQKQCSSILFSDTEKSQASSESLTQNFYAYLVDDGGLDRVLLSSSDDCLGVRDNSFSSFTEIEVEIEKLMSKLSYDESDLDLAKSLLDRIENGLIEPESYKKLLFIKVLGLYGDIARKLASKQDNSVEDSNKYLNIALNKSFRPLYQIIKNNFSRGEKFHTYNIGIDYPQIAELFQKNVASYTDVDLFYTKKKVRESQQNKGALISFADINYQMGEGAISRSYTKDFFDRALDSTLLNFSDLIEAQLPELCSLDESLQTKLQKIAPVSINPQLQDIKTEPDQSIRVGPVQVLPMNMNQVLDDLEKHLERTSGINQNSNAFKGKPQSSSSPASDRLSKQIQSTNRSELREGIPEKTVDQIRTEIKGKLDRIIVEDKSIFDYLLNLLDLNSYNKFKLKEINEKLDNKEFSIKDLFDLVRGNLETNKIKDNFRNDPWDALSVIRNLSDVFSRDELEKFFFESVDYKYSDSVLDKVDEDKQNQFKQKVDEIRDEFGFISQEELMLSLAEDSDSYIPFDTSAFEDIPNELWSGISSAVEGVDSLLEGTTQSWERVSEEVSAGSLGGADGEGVVFGKFGPSSYQLFRMKTSSKVRNNRYNSSEQNRPKDPVIDTEGEDSYKIRLAMSVNSDGKILTPVNSIPKYIIDPESSKKYDARKYFDPENYDNHDLSEFKNKNIIIEFQTGASSSPKQALKYDSSIRDFYTRNYSDKELDLSLRPELQSIVDKWKSRIKNERDPNIRERIQMTAAKDIETWIRTQTNYSKKKASYNAYSGSNEYVGNILLKENVGDCDVANTLFAHILNEELKIPTRNPVGYMGKNGKLRTKSAHGWSEAWFPRNGGWVTFDATSVNVIDGPSNSHSSSLDFISNVFGGKQQGQQIKDSEDFVKLYDCFHMEVANELMIYGVRGNLIQQHRLDPESRCAKLGYKYDIFTIVDLYKSAIQNNIISQETLSIIEAKGQLYLISRLADAEITNRESIEAVSKFIYDEVIPSIRTLDDEKLKDELAKALMDRLVMFSPSIFLNTYSSLIDDFVRPPFNKHVDTKLLMSLKKLGQEVQGSDLKRYDHKSALNLVDLMRTDPLKKAMKVTLDDLAEKALLVEKHLALYGEYDDIVSIVKRLQAISTDIGESVITLFQPVTDEEKKVFSKLNLKPTSVSSLHGPFDFNEIIDEFEFIEQNHNSKNLLEKHLDDIVKNELFSDYVFDMSLNSSNDVAKVQTALKNTSTDKIFSWYEISAIHEKKQQKSNNADDLFLKVLLGRDNLTKKQTEVLIEQSRAGLKGIELQASASENSARRKENDFLDYIVNGSDPNEIQRVEQQNRFNEVVWDKFKVKFYTVLNAQGETTCDPKNKDKFLGWARQSKSHFAHFIKDDAGYDEMFEKIFKLCQVTGHEALLKYTQDFAQGITRYIDGNNFIVVDTFFKNQKNKFFEIIDFEKGKNVIESLMFFMMNSGSKNCQANEVSDDYGFFQNYILVDPDEVILDIFSEMHQVKSYQEIYDKFSNEICGLAKDEAKLITVKKYFDDSLINDIEREKVNYYLHLLSVYAPIQKFKDFNWERLDKQNKYSVDEMKYLMRLTLIALNDLLDKRFGKCSLYHFKSLNFPKEFKDFVESSIGQTHLQDLCQLNKDELELMKYKTRAEATYDHMLRIDADLVDENFQESKYHNLFKEMLSQAKSLMLQKYEAQKYVIHLAIINATENCEVPFNFDEFEIWMADLLGRSWPYSLMSYENAFKEQDTTTLEEFLKKPQTSQLLCSSRYRDNIKFELEEYYRKPFQTFPKSFGDSIQIGDQYKLKIGSNQIAASYMNLQNENKNNKREPISQNTDDFISMKDQELFIDHLKNLPDEKLLPTIQECIKKGPCDVSTVEALITSVFTNEKLQEIYPDIALIVRGAPSYSYEHIINIDPVSNNNSEKAGLRIPTDTRMYNSYGNSSPFGNVSPKTHTVDFTKFPQDISNNENEGQESKNSEKERKEVEEKTLDLQEKINEIAKINDSNKFNTIKNSKRYGFEIEGGISGGMYGGGLPQGQGGNYPSQQPPPGMGGGIGMNIPLPSMITLGVLKSDYKTLKQPKYRPLLDSINFEIKTNLTQADHFNNEWGSAYINFLENITNDEEDNTELKKLIAPKTQQLLNKLHEDGDANLLSELVIRYYQTRPNDSFDFDSSKILLDLIKNTLDEGKSIDSYQINNIDSVSLIDLYEKDLSQIVSSKIEWNEKNSYKLLALLSRTFELLFHEGLSKRHEKVFLRGLDIISNHVNKKLDPTQKIYLPAIYNRFLFSKKRGSDGTLEKEIMNRFESSMSSLNQGEQLNALNVAWLEESKYKRKDNHKLLLKYLMKDEFIEALEQRSSNDVASYPLLYGIFHSLASYAQKPMILKATEPDKDDSGKVLLGQLSNVVVARDSDRYIKNREFEQFIRNYNENKDSPYVISNPPELNDNELATMYSQFVGHGYISFKAFRDILASTNFNYNSLEPADKVTVLDNMMISLAHDSLLKNVGKRYVDEVSGRTLTLGNEYYEFQKMSQQEKLKLISDRKIPLDHSLLEQAKQDLQQFNIPIEGFYSDFKILVTEETY